MRRSRIRIRNVSREERATKNARKGHFRNTRALYHVQFPIRTKFINGGASNGKVKLGGNGGTILITEWHLETRDPVFFLSFIQRVFSIETLFRIVGIQIFYLWLLSGYTRRVLRLQWEREREREERWWLERNDVASTERWGRWADQRGAKRGTEGNTGKEGGSYKDQTREKKKESKRKGEKRVGGGKRDNSTTKYR